ncbi:hypothetical protein CAEBREN_05123 [Caenorhabditis brenneri]|uniref:Uncharacterized protein n=1 Tax=Caenorhabditis brenneri TaxID=135651 RepID=G0NGN0_CAEBE|nr:hypothetical protein CAEBREN_05123 [Caenorhabditis brenneri]
MQPTSGTATNSAASNPLATENMKEVATAGGLIGSIGGDSLEVKMEETPNGKQLSTSPQKKSKAQKRTLPLEKDQQEKKQKKLLV